MAFTVKELASRMSNSTTMCRRKRLVLGDIIRFRLDWKQKPQKVNIRRVPCIEQLSIVQ